MTAYFDAVQRRIMETTDDQSWEVLPEIERSLVFDVLVATMLPGFPADVAPMVDRAILRWGVSTLPHNAPEADFEHAWQHRQRLANLCSDLHSVFHEVAHRQAYGFSDDPRSRLRSLAMHAEDRLEQSAVAAAERGGEGS